MEKEVKKFVMDFLNEKFRNTTSFYKVIKEKSRETPKDYYTIYFINREIWNPSKCKQLLKSLKRVTESKLNVKTNMNIYFECFDLFMEELELKVTGNIYKFKENDINF